ncbi:protein kinase domain-containing protein [Paenibacillus gallinarum]|uniref:Protein kinase n=1 Tax=Paenibacillus gallinarum TaxID=2762232 RepID=A0ABR8T551_9BACL|nr:protein kinase [Paenibacillus gallinarum]MBD7970424.1 protein kinase [Paenibacillus gallinarum]
MEVYKGKEVKDTEGRKYIINNKIGEGAQGAVYDTENDTFLIKIVRVDEDQRQPTVDRFKWIMKQRIPSEARIITPVAILEQPLTGYVMKKAKGHESLNKYIYPGNVSNLGEWYNIQTGGLKKRFEIAISLSKCFRQLHLQGLCYCDVSPNNILISRNHRSIVLIDSDNLTSTSLFTSSILGTPRYIAPELFMLSKQPNSITDTYSFAVILFELLRLGHPLIGDVILNGTPEMEEDAVKGHVVYVDHPNDESNRNSSILPADVLLTEELRGLFQKMFVDGLHEHMKRPTLYEFTSALQRAEDQLIKCDNIQCHAFYYAQDGHAQVCPWCRQKKNEFCKVHIVETANFTDEFFENGKEKISRTLSTIVLNDDAIAIYSRHVGSLVSQDSDKALAIIKKVDDKHVIMKNCSQNNFFILNKETRSRELLKPDETKNLNMGLDNVIFDIEENISGISDIFNKNNRIRGIFFNVN